MGFEDALKKSLKKEKIRKSEPDKVDIRLTRLLVQSLEWISVGYSSALYFAGKKLGKEIVSKEIKGNDIKSLLKFITEFFHGLGIGKIEVVEQSDKRIILHLKECSTCYHMSEVGKPVCFFESGLIAGILESKLSKALVNETLCGGLGDEIDEFQIKVG